MRLKQNSYCFSWDFANYIVNHFFQSFDLTVTTNQIGSLLFYELRNKIFEFSLVWRGKCIFFFILDSSEKIWSVCSSRSRVINSMIYDCLRKKFSYCGFLCLEAFQIDGRDNCYTIIIVLYATTQLTFETILFSFVSSNTANRRFARFLFSSFGNTHLSIIILLLLQSHKMLE